MAKGTSGTTMYQIDPSNIGNALIIDISKFDDGERRWGGKTDYQLRIDTFKTLGFRIHKFQDLTANEMKETLANFAQLKEHASSSMCVVSITSHGNMIDKKSVISGRDMKTIGVMDDVIRPSVFPCATLFKASRNGSYWDLAGETSFSCTARILLKGAWY